jgi:hypothetical protein
MATRAASARETAASWRGRELVDRELGALDLRFELHDRARKDSVAARVARSWSARLVVLDEISSCSSSDFLRCSIRCACSQVASLAPARLRPIS